MKPDTSITLTLVYQSINSSCQILSNIFYPTIREVASIKRPNSIGRLNALISHSSHLFKYRFNFSSDWSLGFTGIFARTKKISSLKIILNSNSQLLLISHFSVIIFRKEFQCSANLRDYLVQAYYRSTRTHQLLQKSIRLVLWFPERPIHVISTHTLSGYLNNGPGMNAFTGMIEYCTWLIHSQR